MSEEEWEKDQLETIRFHLEKMTWREIAVANPQFV